MKDKDDIILYNTPTVPVKKQEPKEFAAKMSMSYTLKHGGVIKKSSTHAVHTTIAMQKLMDEMLVDMKRMHSMAMHPIYTVDADGVTHQKIVDTRKVGFWQRWKADISGYFKKKAQQYADEALLSFSKPTGYKRYIIKKHLNLEFK